MWSFVNSLPVQITKKSHFLPEKIKLDPFISIFSIDKRRLLTFVLNLRAFFSVQYCSIMYYVLYLEDHDFKLRLKFCQDSFSHWVKNNIKIWQYNFVFLELWERSSVKFSEVQWSSVMVQGWFSDGPVNVQWLVQWKM